MIVLVECHQLILQIRNAYLALPARRRDGGRVGFLRQVLCMFGDDQGLAVPGAFLGVQHVLSGEEEDEGRSKKGKCEQDGEGRRIG